MKQFRAFLSDHPRIAMWLILAVGMVVILLWTSRDVDLLVRQRLALVVATVGLAGLCVWIIGWEEGMEDEPSDQ